MITLHRPSCSHARKQAPSCAALSWLRARPYSGLPRTQAAMAELLRVDPAQRLSALALPRQPWVCGACGPMEAAAAREPVTLCTQGPATLHLTARAGGPPAEPAPLAGACAPGSGLRSEVERGPPSGESGERLSRALYTLQLLRGGPGSAGDLSLAGAPNPNRSRNCCWYLRTILPADDARYCACGRNGAPATCNQTTPAPVCPVELITCFWLMHKPPHCVAPTPPRSRHGRVRRGAPRCLARRRRRAARAGACAGLRRMAAGGRRGAGRGACKPHGHAGRPARRPGGPQRRRRPGPDGLAGPHAARRPPAQQQ